MQLAQCFLGDHSQGIRAFHPNVWPMIGILLYKKGGDRNEVLPIESLLFLNIARRGKSQYGKAIYHWKAQSVLYKLPILIFF
jgi:hypothetical protein